MIPSTGIWGLAPKDKPNDVLARFLKVKLMPIQHLADFVGVEGFDWLSGAFAPQEDIESSLGDTEADDDDDEEIADADDDGKSEDSECTTSSQETETAGQGRRSVEKTDRHKMATANRETAAWTRLWPAAQVRRHRAPSRRC